MDPLPLSKRTSRALSRTWTWCASSWPAWRRSQVSAEHGHCCGAPGSPRARTPAAKLCIAICMCCCRHRAAPSCADASLPSCPLPPQPGGWGRLFTSLLRQRGRARSAHNASRCQCILTLSACRRRDRLCAAGQVARGRRRGGGRGPHRPADAGGGLSRPADFRGERRRGHHGRALPHRAHRARALRGGCAGRRHHGGRCPLSRGLCVAHAHAGRAETRLPNCRLRVWWRP
jgi:hypothetical protein